MRVGATLVATSATSDVTLSRLASVPPGRWSTTRFKVTLRWRNAFANPVVFAAGLTNNEYRVTVTDTQTCKTWEVHPHAQSGNLVDFEAFPFP